MAGLFGNVEWGPASLQALIVAEVARGQDAGCLRRAWGARLLLIEEGARLLDVQLRLLAVKGD